VSERSYLAEIEEFFISTIRRGLMLRAGDVDVIRDWEARRVPLAVVRRGIAIGVRRFLESAEPSTALPSSLKYFRTDVEAEFERYRRASGLLRSFDSVRARANAPACDPFSIAESVLEEAAEGAQDEPERRRYVAAMERLRDLQSSGVAAAQALDAVDDDLVTAFLADATEQVREAVLARVRARRAEAERRGAGVSALEEIERAERHAAVAELSKFPGLVTLVLQRM